MMTIKRAPVLLILLSVIGVLLFAASNRANADAYSQGLEVLAAGDTQKAIKLFSQAIAANPDEFHVYNDRGVAYKISGNPDKALADYTKALELKPDYANALNNRGVIYLQKGLYDNAIEDFTEALKSTELKSKVHTNLGIAYAQKGNHRQAVENLEAALSFRPLDHRAFLFMAESLEQLEEYEKAGKMYQLSVGLAKDSSTADMIEKKIAQLESISKSGSRKDNVDEGRKRFTGSSETRVIAGHEKESSGSRRSFQEKPAARSSLNQMRTREASGSPLEAVHLLEVRCRSRALDKLSPAAAEIYKQGVEFLEKAQFRQALIRFEDILQLEKRNRNTAAIALSSLQLGRTYLKMGDYATAGTKLQDALRIFRQINASEETILTLLEIAAVKKAAGQNDKATEVYALAKEQAHARGNGQLAQGISDLQAGKTIPTPSQTAAAIRDTMARSQRVPSDQKAFSRTKQTAQTPPAASPIARDEDKKSGNTIVRSDPEKTKQMAAGRGPELRPGATNMKVLPASPVKTSSEREPQKKPESRPQKMILAKNRATSGEKPVSVETLVGGQQQAVTKEKRGSQASPQLSGVNIEEQHVPTTKKSQRASKQASWDLKITETLSQLKKYKNANDETNMIFALENLAEIYSNHRQYDKALHSLIAAIGFRERLNRIKGIDKLYIKRGLIREKLGDSAGALADLTRALYSFDVHESLSFRRALEAKIRKIASAINLDPRATIGAYQTLWRARNRTGDLAETYALYAIARLYDRAEKNEQALSYYDQSSASILADKARVYEKIGQKALAAQSYKSALEAFKKLDYSRYLSLLKQTENR